MSINVPRPTKADGQRSISQDDMYLTRYIPQWSRNTGISADAWRAIVMNQPIAVICRETLNSNMLSLDWKVSARDSKYQDDLRTTIKHYTKLIERGGEYMGLDYSGLVEWISTDLLDLPFGGAAELGRRNDSESGRVLWFKPLDGGTLFPTLNTDYPVMQWHPAMDKVVWFPKHAVARTYMSPRPELKREGWGLAPPEKVMMALEMLWRGDKYYAGLLLDVPPVGILDLGDMEKSSALEWVESFRNFLDGSNASKIPVLYEHTTKPDFISLGKVPNDIMYDRISLKFAAIVAAAYGLSLSDIGLQTASASGETLAGSIRQERRTQRTGIAVAKKKLTAFFNTILPENLEFSFIDYDDEANVARSSARLANATAMGLYIDKGILDRGEARRQIIRDGMVTISIPEEPPEMDTPETDVANAQVGELGNPVAVSSGGQGEAHLSSITVDKSDYFDDKIYDVVRNLSNLLLELKVTDEDVVARSLFVEDELGLNDLISRSWDGITLSLAGYNVEAEKELATIIKTRMVDALVETKTTAYLMGESDELITKGDIENSWHGGNINRNEFTVDVLDDTRQFIGKTVIYMLKSDLTSQGGIDSGDSVDYDSTIQRVSDHIISKVDDIVQTCVSNSIDKLFLEEVKNA